MDEKTENIHSGHRKRVRESYIKRGNLEGYADHQILEMLLFYGIPRRDVNPLAHKLINRFGSLRKVLKAEYAELVREGLPENAATLIKLVGDIGKTMDRKEVYGAIIANTDDAFSACHRLLFREETEVVCILCLDARNRIINISMQDNGLITRAEAFPKWIVDTAISQNAVAIVLAHNHPSGICQPSMQDNETTKLLEGILNSLGILLYDHVIVTHSACYSIKRNYERSDMIAQYDFDCSDPSDDIEAG